MSPRVPSAEAVFQLEVNCDPPTVVGQIPGGQSLMIPITGGRVTGEHLSGEVLPGGADWARRYDDGRIVVDARYAIRADDGTIIQVFNTASQYLSADSAGPDLTMLTTPRFIAPEGPHSWLNHAVFVGTLAPDIETGAAVHIVIYRMV